MNKQFIKSYLTDLHLICESKNFTQTFNVPERISSLGVDAEELECTIMRIFNSDEFQEKDKFFELFDHMKVDEEHPETVDIVWHVSHDDFTTEDEENWFNIVQNAMK